MDGLFCLFVCLSGLADDPSFGLVLNTTFGSGPSGGAATTVLEFLSPWNKRSFTGLELRKHG